MFVTVPDRHFTKNETFRFFSLHLHACMYNSKNTTLTRLEVINKLRGTSQKVKRAQVLLKADADGPNWPHYQIAEAFLCRLRTVTKVCKSLAERGFDITLI